MAEDRSEIHPHCCQGVDPSCDGPTECARRGWAQVDRLRAENDAFRQCGQWRTIDEVLT